MHSMAALAARRAGLSGVIASVSSWRVLVGMNAPLASRHFSKKRVISVARSLITGRFSSGPILRPPFLTTFDTWVRQVQRGRPLTVMAQEPQTPTRQANRYDKEGSR